MTKVAKPSSSSTTDPASSDGSKLEERLDSNDRDSTPASTPSDSPAADPDASPVQNDVPSDPEEVEEEWDISEELPADTDRTCMSEDCGNKAVAIWKSNREGEDPWYSCVECQKRDFGLGAGGWPEGFVRRAGGKDYDEQSPPGDASAEDASGGEASDETKTSADGGATEQDPKEEGGDEEEDSARPLKISTKRKSKRVIDDDDDNEGNDAEKEEAQANDDEDDGDDDDDAEKEEARANDDNNANQESENCSEGASDGAGDEEEGEKWDLKLVYSAGDIKKATQTCSTEGCELVACSIWVSHENTDDPDEYWHSCLDCQENDFGGWPDVGPELPLKVMKDDHRRLIAEKCTLQDNPVMPALPSSPASIESDVPKETNVSGKTPQATGESASAGANDGRDDDEEEGEKWDLKLVYSAGDIKKAAQTCSTEGCELVACSIWVSHKNPDDPDEYWHSCLDCQENDFGGWPNVGPDLPLKVIKEDHKSLIAEKCTLQDNPAMPALPSSPVCHESDSPSSKMTTAVAVPGKTVTPPPGKGLAKAKGGGATNMATATSETKKGELVTPSPVPPSSKPAKPSASSLAIHRKWQEAAEAMGGPGTRIVVSKPAAKKLIFDMLHESFAPMNITDIYKKLKAAVPSPVLKSCLDDMALDKSAGNPFDESDDDGDDDENISSKKKKKSSDENIASSSDDQYAGSLSIKVGRNTNTTLYFVDQTKLHNNGDGLVPEERNSLICDFEKSKGELESNESTLKETLAEAAKLESEPTNEEADSKLESEEQEMQDVRASLESARALKGNEKHKARTKRRIDSMATAWRRRKRLCVDFLIMMEESTDGTVSMKKCMSGDGAIDIDSDDAVAAGAVAWRKKKKARFGGTTSNKGRTTKPSLGGRLGGMKSSNGKDKFGADSITSGIAPDEDFVAVSLDATGNVSRIYLEDEE